MQWVCPFCSGSLPSLLVITRRKTHKIDRGWTPQKTGFLKLGFHAWSRIIWAEPWLGTETSQNPTEYKTRPYIHEVMDLTRGLHWIIQIYVKRLLKISSLWFLCDIHSSVELDLRTEKSGFFKLLWTGIWIWHPFAGLWITTFGLDCKSSPCNHIFM